MLKLGRRLLWPQARHKEQSKDNRTSLLRARTCCVSAERIGAESVLIKGTDYKRVARRIKLVTLTKDFIFEASTVLIYFIYFNFQHLHTLLSFAGNMDYPLSRFPVRKKYPVGAFIRHPAPAVDSRSIGETPARMIATLGGRSIIEKSCKTPARTPEHCRKVGFFVVNARIIQVLTSIFDDLMHRIEFPLNQVPGSDDFSAIADDLEFFLFMFHFFHNSLEVNCHRRD